MKQEILRLEGVTCKNGDTIVFSNMTLNIMAGEIMGLCPINTFGIDELLDVIVNNPPLYYGYVYYQEHCVNSWKESRRSKNRICVIGSETSLVNGLDVVTNIFTLRAGFGQEILNNRFLIGQLQPFLDEIGISLEPDTMVENLTPYERVVVELLRAVVAGYHLIILREISTVVSENELQDLYKMMQYYAERGFSFIYISYHFEEIQQVCSRAALMSEECIDLILDETQIKAGLDRALYQDYYNQVSDRVDKKMSGLIFYRNYYKQVNNRVQSHVNQQGEELLNVRNLTGKYLKNFNYSVYQGECVVLQFLETQMYKEMLDIIEFEKGPLYADIYIKGKKMKGYKSRHVAFLKEEASKTMIFEHLSVRDNLCIALDNRMPSIWRNGKMQKSVREEYYRVFGDDIFEKSVSELTESERINLIYMRILLEKPKVVFIAQPFKHADMSHRLQIWGLHTKLLERGISIVILAVNMSDSLTIADRLIRIGTVNDKMVIREYKQEQFAELPLNLPWVKIFDER